VSLRAKNSIHGELQQNVSAVGVFCLRMQQHVGLNVDPSPIACVSVERCVTSPIE